MWQNPEEMLPDEELLVTVQVKGKLRSGYYRIEDRWYALVDLDRWQMNTSPYWIEDRTWYVETESIQAWTYEENRLC